MGLPRHSNIDLVAVRHCPHLRCGTCSKGTVRHTVTFDGDDAIQYPFGDQYASMADSFSIECVLRYNGDLPSEGQTNLCANKEAGGFAVAMFQVKSTFELHTGRYQNIGVDIEPNEWYHAVAVFDGANQMARLYVNGELAAEVETVGTQMVWPPDTTAHNMTLGAYSSKGGSQFHSTSTLASARVFSQPLNGPQVAALNIEAFDGLRDQQAEIVSSTPAADEELTRATEFVQKSIDLHHAGDDSKLHARSAFKGYLNKALLPSDPDFWSTASQRKVQPTAALNSTSWTAASTRSIKRWNTFVMLKSAQCAPGLREPASAEASSPSNSKAPR